MPGDTTRYEIRPSAESTFALEVSKTGLMTGKKHVLFFEQYAGEVNFDAQRPENSSARLTVEARSVACKDAWLKKKEDRKKIVETAVNDMMAAAQYPQLTFSSTSVSAKPRGQFEIQGNLTVRGISKPITFIAAAKPSGIDRLEIDGDAEIDLKDYGLKPPSALGGLIGTKSKMTLRFLVWAEKTAK
ncbi:MAG TPA: YceI family protein [Bryobacteraceae bacterium]|nr:YceI family protein [Bryobacteraceae bacterium]